MSTQTLTALNAYNGINIWQDVILTLDGYDETATEAIDPNGQSDRFVAAGITYRYDPAEKCWISE